MTHYLDTSVVVALVLRDVHTAKAEAWLEGAGAACVISDFGVVEFASVVSRRVRMRHMSSEHGHAALDVFDEWVARTAHVAVITGEHLEIANRIVREFDRKLTAPDALHVAISKSLGSTLVTFDQRLATAAKREKLALVVPT